MLSAERAALSALAGLATGLVGLLYMASRSRPGIAGAAPPLPPIDLPPGRIVAVAGRGEMLAQLLARRHPDVVRGLVLCASAASFADRMRERWIWRGMGGMQIALRLLPRFWLPPSTCRQPSSSPPETNWCPATASASSRS